MGWFFRKKSSVKTETDPISLICRSLVEEPWTWSTFATDEPGAWLKHVSGVVIYYTSGVDGEDHDVQLSSGSPARAIRLPYYSGRRVYEAIVGHAAAKLNTMTMPSDQTCEALVKAYQAGQKDAVYGLADRLFELRGGTSS